MTDEERKRIQTPAAPMATAPYSQAIVANGMVFCAGQVPIDPATNQVVSGDIRVQTRRVLDNLEAVLRAAGSSLQYAVKTTVFLAQISDFAAMNEVYAQYFGSTPPARSTVEVSALTRDALLEIECIAVIPNRLGTRQFSKAPHQHTPFDLDSDSDI
ncbi:MAG TPA: RidA family protein [Chloroflexia bacterium]|nr:RidA family protein [Chloroflexia bacterium]